MKLSNRLNLLLLTLIAVLNFTLHADAARLYPEKQYQTVWCAQNGGKAEVILYDKTRVDCILPEYAIEFDFANKWSEAVGQSLYYSCITGKKAGIVLIIEDMVKDRKYLSRLNKIAPHHGITVWTMRPADLQKCSRATHTQICKKTENY